MYIYIDIDIDIDIYVDIHIYCTYLLRSVLTSINHYVFNWPIVNALVGILACRPTY